MRPVSSFEYAVAKQLQEEFNAESWTLEDAPGSLGRARSLGGNNLTHLDDATIITRMWVLPLSSAERGPM
jgi:hypothetical protein